MSESFRHPGGIRLTTYSCELRSVSRDSQLWMQYVHQSSPHVEREQQIVLQHSLTRLLTSHLLPPAACNLGVFL